MDRWVGGWVSGWMERQTDINDAVSSSAMCHQTAGFKNNVLTKCGRYYHCTGTQGLGK
jgi:hypothetical protein